MIIIQTCCRQWQNAAMCIAIPPPVSRHPAAGRGPWHWLSARPDRLAVASALGQLAALGLAGGPPAATAMPLATLLLGLVMQELPRRVRSLPISRPRRVGVFAALLVGGILSGNCCGAAGGVSGTLLLVAGWWSALRPLHWKLRWASGTALPAARVALTITELLALGAFAALLAGIA
jgi:hypothetical protein